MNCIDSTIDIKSLEGTGFDEAAYAFQLAFADYDTAFSREQLRAMLRRRGADFNLSAGAFSGGNLVSFIFNGIGEFNGLPTAYDTGTGTVPDFRGRGLTDRIFSDSLPALRAAGVRQYLLEVLTHNVPAVKIYTRQGFEIAREFNCYAAPRRCADACPATAHDVKIEPAPVSELAALAGFMDFEPSWQNSLDSLRRAGSAIDCVIAYAGNCPVGFGATEAAYGDIALLAVSPEHRRRGIGSALLARLASLSATDRVKVINVDSRCSSLNAFLAARAFELTCTQFEMIRPLS